LPCDTRLKTGQTISQRAEEVRRVVKTIDSFLARGTVKVRVGPQGAVVFDGVPVDERDGVTDACIYRRLMATGSGLAKAQIAKAELMAGRSINKQAIAQGHHSHDGGKTWHDGH
jgi:hypothetical protein